MEQLQQPKTFDLPARSAFFPIYLAIKRFTDILGSLIGMIVLSPLFLVIAILIVCEDGGPVFFSQKRVTKGGREFYMHKFRSMCVNAENMLDDLQDENEMDGPVFKMKDDPRITKIGHFLRKSSLDELPQLWNVFVGEMSLVGPRPPLPEEVRHYTEYDMHRLDVTGGLTCYWQVSGRNNIGFEDWVELDLKYIREMSLWTDLKILLRTVKCVLTRDGAM